MLTEAGILLLAVAAVSASILFCAWGSACLWRVLFGEKELSGTSTTARGPAHSNELVDTWEFRDDVGAFAPLPDGATGGSKVSRNHVIEDDIRAHLWERRN